MVVDQRVARDPSPSYSVTLTVNVPGVLEPVPVVVAEGVAVIVTVPGARAVSRPEADTVATAVFDDFQSTAPAIDGPMTCDVESEY